MTVSYTADVANASAFGCFTAILLRWRGSVYKLVFKELVAYVAAYFILNAIYRTVLCQKGYEYYRWDVGNKFNAPRDDLSNLD